MDVLTALQASPPQTSRPAQIEFTARVDPHLPLLKRFALRLTGNPHDSEDLVQDVLLKLFERAERMDEVEALQPWLMRVMYYHFIDRRRRNAPLADHVSIDDVAEPEQGSGLGARWDTDGAGVPEDLVDRLQVADAVTMAIGRLPEQQRVLVRLHDIEGLTLPEIAAHFGLSINTVKSSLSRARLRLRSCLDQTRLRHVAQSLRRRANSTAESPRRQSAGN